MNDLVTDIKSLELETLKNLKSSKALNTLRAYKADFKDFAHFCIKNSFKPIPSEPKIISLYLTYLSKTSKYSTLKRRLASISVIHKLSGHYIDTKHPMITENLMGIKRIKGSHQKAKKPILINDLKIIIDVIDKEKNNHKKYKNNLCVMQ
jgi:site-specific recombinase XerD